MSVKMRLTRMGDKKAPFYRIVVMDSKAARDAEYIDQIGYFNPKTQPEVVKIDAEKAEKWINNGAELSETVKSLLRKNGVQLPEKKAKARLPKKEKKVDAKKEIAPKAKKTTKKEAK